MVLCSATLQCLSVVCEGLNIGPGLMVLVAVKDAVLYFHLYRRVYVHVCNVKARVSKGYLSGHGRLSEVLLVWFA